jgi:hypothetical protein
MFPMLNKLMPTSSSPDSSRSILKLSDQEKLLVYYVIVLYFLRDDESVLKLREKYQKDIKGSILFYGNIQRVLGLIYLRKLEINEAMDAFKKGEDYYERSKCVYGVALCKYSMGVMYKSNFSELLKQAPSTSASVSPSTLSENGILQLDPSSKKA